MMRRSALALPSRFRGALQAGLLCVSLAGALACASAQQIQILSLSQNGLLTWSNATLNATCRVEWASSLQGPWFSSWDALASIVVTHHVTQCSVPMFYRVVCAQLVTNITPAAPLALLNSHKGDTNLVILDLRTPAEYAPRHIKGAVNLDYYAANFDASLGSLDRGKLYLVYCGSGRRSGWTADKMRTLGFLQVYNMTGGFSTFADLSGAAEFLEP
jgi:rhodanese-related sulfurtransferase